MKRNKELMILAAAYILLLLVMFILPFYSVPEYSIIRNNLSQLGAQFTPNSGIMNFSFITLGIGSLISGWKYLEGYMFQRIFLFIFGISLTLAAFFNHAPINPEIQYDLSEDGWHSYFACTAGLSFTIFTFTTAFILERLNDKVFTIAIGLSSIILSILIFKLDQFMGVWHRLIFITSFGWMIYIFSWSKMKIH